MGSSELSNFATRPGVRATPQSEQAEPTQVRNYAGGFTFQVDPWTRLTRFLVLGTEGGTYYASARKHTKDNASSLLSLIEQDGERFVQTVVEVSQAGRAPKNDQALFALALATAAKDVGTRRAAFQALPQVARIGTHLFQFMQMMENQRGWGRQARRAVARWYEDKPADRLAYQAVKYQQRDGWSHWDALRLSHPRAATPEHSTVYDFIRGKADGWKKVPAEYGRMVDRTPETDVDRILFDFDALRSDPTEAQTVEIARSGRVPWEAFLTEQRTAKVWAALLEANAVPLGATLRQLPTLTRLGLMKDLNIQTSITGRLQDVEELRRARLHPMNILIAMRTYAGGHSLKGESTWSPVGPVIDALDASFYKAFGAVTPANKRTMFALDVSGSMGSSISGLPISCREAAVAMALVSASVEPAYSFVGFTAGSGGYSFRSRSAQNPNDGISQLSITPRQRLDDACAAIYRLPFGATDCALPMLYALKQGLEIDTFNVITDNETWAGHIHPHEALQRYRKETGIPARLVVTGMTATDFTIADPSDVGMMDVVGFDTAAPNLISDFSRGDF